MNEKADFLPQIQEHQEQSDEGALIVLAQGLQTEEQEVSDAMYLTQVFDAVIRQQKEHSRRPPIQFQRIWDAFRGNKKEVITLEEISKDFPAQKTAQDAISRLNEALAAYGVEIEHVSAYRLRRLKP